MECGYLTKVNSLYTKPMEFNVTLCIWIKGEYNCIQCRTVAEEMDPSMVRKQQNSESYRDSDRCKVHISYSLCFPPTHRLYQSNIIRQPAKSRSQIKITLIIQYKMYASPHSASGPSKAFFTLQKIHSNFTCFRFNLCLRIISLSTPLKGHMKNN